MKDEFNIIKPESELTSDDLEGAVEEVGKDGAIAEIGTDESIDLDKDYQDLYDILDNDAKLVASIELIRAYYSKGTELKGPVGLDKGILMDKGITLEVLIDAIDRLSARSKAQRKAA